MKTNKLILLLVTILTATFSSSVFADYRAYCEHASIWVYRLGPCDHTFTITNNTAYPAKIMGVPSKGETFPVNTIIQPYSSISTYVHSKAGAYLWKGSLTIVSQVEDPKDVGYRFTVGFFQQNKGSCVPDICDNGNWISLTKTVDGFPTPKYSYLVSSAYAGSENRWWSTKINSKYNGRNYMSLVSDRFMASLFSNDNMNINIVIGDAPAKDGDYKTYQLEWKQNMGETFPPPIDDFCKK